MGAILACLIVKRIIMGVCLYINIMYTCMYDLIYIIKIYIDCCVENGLWKPNLKSNSKEPEFHFIL